MVGLLLWLFLMLRCTVSAFKEKGIVREIKMVQTSLSTPDNEEVVQLLHWGAIDGEWEKAVMNLGNNRQAVVDYGNNVFNNVTRLSRVNRFYGYNGYNGGILALWRNTALTPPDDKRGVFRNLTYQPLRTYSTTYQGNKGY